MRSSLLKLALALSLVACGDDPPSDTQVPPPLGGGGSSSQAGGAGGTAGGSSGGAGEAGTGAEAGQSGAAGAVGEAGTGGAGAGGDSGSGGAGAGGEAGQGGSGGGNEAGSGGSDAGSGGSAAGSAGSDAGADGQGGASGAGGDAGAGAGGGAGQGGAGAGGGGQGGAGGGVGEPANLMFVTSAEFNPVKTAGEADKLCAQLAAQAGLPEGTYVAWLSTKGKDAIDKLAGASGWVRVDGLPFAGTAQDLAAGKVFYPPRMDEMGKVVPQNSRVATGTLPDGTVSDLNCSDWTKENEEYFSGDPASGTALWTERNQVGCSQPARYYCFQIDHAAKVAVPPIPAGGRRIFVTDKPFLPVAGGLAAADAQCSQEAVAAGLPGKYVALLATDKQPASARVSPDNRPWFRPDGVQVAAAGQLTGVGSGDLLAPPLVTASGDYTTENAWTGDSGPAQSPSSKLTCSGWTSTDGPTFLGNNGPTDPTWFAGALTSCADEDNRLRCVQK